MLTLPSFSPADPVRRRLLSWLALPACAALATASRAAAPEAADLKAGYAGRLKRLLAKGALPYIDIESSCNPGKLDIASLAAALDRLDIGLMAMSGDVGPGMIGKGVRYSNLSEKLLAAYPDRFIPVGDGALPPGIPTYAGEFLAAQERAATEGKILLFGEYELRHYPSPRQVKRGEMERDVNIAIDGPVGEALFAMSARTGLPFQIHYEIEDALLPPLETMLGRYPAAKVIWCHLAQIRYEERARRYSSGYVESLIQRFPNLHFDLAFGDFYSIYPLSNQRHARVWADNGQLRDDWRELIVAYPQRFLSALDLGGDRLFQINEYDRKHRDLLARLPVATRHQVAYRSAWSLLFGEEFA